MKIAILLPYKENFSPEYAGAVSIFINSVTNLSVYKKDITVYGNTKFKNSSEIEIGIDHDEYSHTTKLTDSTIKSLSSDFN